MRVLLFPTRFYPAISGGDFFIQRIGEDFLNIYNGKVKLLPIITSDAIDFAALRGFHNGKRITPKHNFFKRYSKFSLIRLKTNHFDTNEISNNHSNNIETLPLFKETINIFSNLFREYDFEISTETISFFFKQGPIFSELNELLISKNDFESMLLLKKGFNRKIQIHSLLMNTDIVHTSYFPYSNILYALMLAKKYEIKSVITPFLHPENIRYKNREFFRIIQMFDKIHACTYFEKRLYINNGISKEKIIVLPMGVDIERMNKKFSPKQQSNLRKIFNIDNSAKNFIVLFCGYKNFEKGAITLLNSLKTFYNNVFIKEQKIPKQKNKKENKLLNSNIIKKLVVIFIGPSSIQFNYELKKIRKKIPNLIIHNITPENLDGYFDNKKIFAFQIADVYCMPSRSEAYGIAYLEAWATKKPIIAADIPALQEIVNDKKGGLLIPFNDTDALSRALEKIYYDISLRLKLGENGFNSIKSQNNWSRISDSLLNIYKNLINNKNKNPIN